MAEVVTAVERAAVMEVARAVATEVAWAAARAAAMAVVVRAVVAWEAVARAALMAGVGAALAVVASMYRERRKHESAQNVFAPSLREELERGISQLDFELSYSSKSRVWNVPALVSFGTGVLLVEVGRLNGESTPWMMLAVAVGGVLSSVWVGFAAKKKAVEQIEQRKHALVSMRAALDENAL
jgi:hypothetical protein